MKNMPTLKAHLQEEWDKLECRGKASQKRKRKIEDSEHAVVRAGEEEFPETGPISKRAKSESEDILSSLKEA